MQSEPINPHLFVIFGGTGDLARRKLLPALFQLWQEHQLGNRSKILAVARNSDFDDQAYRNWLKTQLLQFLKNHPDQARESELATWCDANLFYHSLSPSSSSSSSNSDGQDSSYQRLAERVQALDTQYRFGGNRVLYMALPPNAFADTINQLVQVKLHKSQGWVRLVVEKPFGEDLTSSKQLNQQLHRYFDEQQIFRLDHYLGKETVQNLMVFRFSNMLFESVWNRDRIDNVQITIAEDLGVGGRAGYYDQVGALRDMIQNHAMQLLTLIAMDAPPKFEANELRDEKLRVLRSIDRLSIEDAVFGQYCGAAVSKKIPSYRQEVGVGQDSTTETFVALKLGIDNWRWQGVPFYLRTGKRLSRKVTEIVIVFREPPICFFRPLGACASVPDYLRIRLQPDEAFSLSFNVKQPGRPLKLLQQSLEFLYADVFTSIPDAYPALLLDIIQGDQTHFVRADEVEASWSLLSNLIGANNPVFSYAAGSWGPNEADALLQKHGHYWIDSEK